MSSSVIPRTALRSSAALLSIALSLAACGGGGDGGSAATPTAATPTPVQPAVIATQPAPQSADVGTKATFSVNATGSGLTYQWKRDGKDIPGATAASYTLDDVQPGDDGSVVTVEVRNAGGSVVSGGAALRVTVPKGLSLLAGHLGGMGNLDGQDGRLEIAYVLAASPAGTLYVTDSPLWFGLGGALRTVDPATGVIGTVGRYPDEEAPQDIEFDAAGNRYDMLGGAIYKTTPGGVRSLLAGAATPGDAKYDANGRPADGTGANASFGGLADMAIDGDGNLYVSEYGTSRIRKVDPTGKVVTLAGNLDRRVVDGTGDKASFQSPQHLTVDRAGNVFVIDLGNPFIQTATKLRKMTPAGVVTTVALKAPDGTPVDLGNESYSNALAHAAGNLYVTTTGNGCRIRRIGPDGTITDFAGSATARGNADGKGTAARFCGDGPSLTSLATDKAGNLLVLDNANTTIRRVTLDGDVTTIAGRAPSVDNQDGKGAAASFAYARFPEQAANPGFDPGHYELAVDQGGNVYVGAGDRIRKVTASGNASTMPSAATAGARHFVGGLGYGDRGIALSNNVLSRIDADGALRFVAGLPGSNNVQVDATGANAVFQNPYDVVTDGLGNIHLHDLRQIDRTGMRVFSERKVTTDGVVTTRPLTSISQSPAQWHAAKDGVLWAANYKGDVYQERPDGTDVVVRKAPAGFSTYPTAITRDASGNVYLATQESANPVDARGVWFVVRKIAPDGTETVIAGTEGSAGVRLGSPGSLGRVDALAMGADGILYLMTENAVLRLKQ